MNGCTFAAAGIAIIAVFLHGDNRWACFALAVVYALIAIAVEVWKLRKLDGPQRRLSAHRGPESDGRFLQAGHSHG